MIYSCQQFQGTHTESKLQGSVEIDNTYYMFNCDHNCNNCRITLGSNLAGVKQPDPSREHSTILRERCLSISNSRVNECNRACTRCVIYDGFGRELWVETAPDDPEIVKCKSGSSGDGGNGGSGGTGGIGNNCGDGTHEELYTDPLRHWVEIRAASGHCNRYGFDSWREIVNDSHNSGQQGVSYVSVGIGERFTTFIEIGIGLSINAYDRFEARIINGTGTISFTGNTRDTAIVLAPGTLRRMQIFGHKEGTAEIEVWARNDSRGEWVCVAGDENKHGHRLYDRLLVKIYGEHTFADFNVYYVNDPTFRPTSIQWRDGFDGILRQMVARLGNVNVRQSANGWDVNNNGRLDIIADFGFSVNDHNKFNTNFPANRTWVSEDYLLADTNRVLNDIMNDRIHVHFIVPSPINLHYVVREIHGSGSLNILELHTMNGLEGINGAIYRISKYYDPTDPGELIRIYAITDISGRNVVRFEKLDGSTILNNINFARDNITIHRDDSANATGIGRIRGFAVLNVSFTVDNSDYNLHVHEFLHHTRNNHYPHVQNLEQHPYTLNIMKTALSNSREIELRYRRLRTDNSSTYSQWSHIRE